MSETTSAVSCSKWLPWIEDSPLSPLKANPDIAGIGVLIAFTATAYITLLVVIVYYFLGCVDAQFLNPLDRACLRTFGGSLRASERQAKTLEKAVLMFSDQKVVSSIALLVAGYAQLQSGLAAYHWQILVYLVWFSSLTHLTTLTFLRSYFRSNPASRSWRIVFMLVTVIMLGTALLPTGQQDWYSGSGIPALCYFNRIGSSSYYGLSGLSSMIGPSSMIVSILTLFFGYMTRLVKLSERTTKKTRRWFRTAPACTWKRWMANCDQSDSSRSSKSLQTLSFMFLETIYVYLHACYEVYESMLWEILWLALALAWGTTQLFSTWSPRQDGTASEETVWGLGQLLPLILLILPILSLGETYYEYRISAEKNGGDSDTRQANNAHDDGTLVNYPDNRSSMLRIGQWSLRPSPVKYLSSPRSHTKPRSGAGLPYMEYAMVNRLDNPSSATNGRLSDDTNIIEQHQATNNLFPSYPRNYYRYEWFRLLVATILLIFVEAAAIFISKRTNVLGGFPISIITVSTIVILPGSWVAISVILMEYHKPIGRFLEQRIGISRSVQRGVLRFAAYITFLGFSALLPIIFLLGA